MTNQCQFSEYDNNNYSRLTKMLMDDRLINGKIDNLIPNFRSYHFQSLKRHFESEIL